jgi:hypothetical protein
MGRCSSGRMFTCSLLTCARECIEPTMVGRARVGNLKRAKLRQGGPVPTCRCADITKILSQKGPPNNSVSSYLGRAPQAARLYVLHIRLPHQAVHQSHTSPIVDNAACPPTSRSISTQHISGRLFRPDIHSVLNRYILEEVQTTLSTPRQPQSQCLLHDQNMVSSCLWPCNAT